MLVTILISDGQKVTKKTLINSLTILVRPIVHENKLA